MLSAPLYLSTDLGNGCWDTRALLQGNEGVHRLAGSECVLLGPTVEWGTQSCKALFETPCIINQQVATLAVLCLLTTTSMLYMFRTPFASVIRSTINCNNSHWCLSWVKMEKVLYSCQGRCTLVRTDLDIYTGFIPSQLMTNTSGCCYSL